MCHNPRAIRYTFPSVNVATPVSRQHRPPPFSKGQNSTSLWNDYNSLLYMSPGSSEYHFFYCMLPRWAMRPRVYGKILLAL